jgi:quercetin dioxygenase-like cupin family protein
MNYSILDRADLPHDGNVYEFEGIRFEAAEVSFIWVDMPPGGAIRLHKHPYQEIFIIQEGVATFTVDSTTLEAQAGQVIIVHANVAHKFKNLSDRQLRQIDIHVNNQFVTEWLEK